MKKVSEIENFKSAIKKMSLTVGVGRPVTL